MALEAGNPALLHLMAVCLAGKTDLQKKTGILHDIIEDTDMTLDGLREKGVEEEVIRRWTSSPTRIRTSMRTIATVVSLGTCRL